MQAGEGLPFLPLAKIDFAILDLLQYMQIQKQIKKHLRCGKCRKDVVVTYII